MRKTAQHTQDRGALHHTHQTGEHSITHFNVSRWLGSKLQPTNVATNCRYEETLCLAKDCPYSSLESCPIHQGQYDSLELRNAIAGEGVHDLVNHTSHLLQNEVAQHLPVLG